MDPRLKNVLRTLLELALESAMKGQAAPVVKRRRRRRLSQAQREEAYWRKQLEPGPQHITKPQFTQTTNFGGA